jgi:beta-hydroxylase
MEVTMAERMTERLREGALEAGAQVMERFEGRLLRYSEVPTTPFLDTATFPWVAELEASWTQMRTELDEILRHQEDLPNFQDISVDQRTITDDDRWKTFFFTAFGYRSDVNCARCPKTAALLDDVPGLITAFFSILASHKHIEAHRGPWRGLLRYHLALRVPEPAESCGISVGGEVRHWREGSSLLFDDGYEHFAWNDTDDVRVVLFVDVLRPLRGRAEAFNRGLIRAISLSPFVLDGKRRHRAWERRFEALHG